MAVNKVQIGEDEVLVDLSNDTVVELAVDDGVQFHSSDGEVRIGARVIDDEMSDTSTNAPQNKVVKKYVDDGLAKKSDVGHTHDTSEIVTGVFNTDRIPTIDSDKIQSLDASKLTGTVPSDVLPSYVDDVIEGYYYNEGFYSDETHNKAIEGETGKIYVSLDTNKTYRYSGSIFVVISETLALGETSSTAYRGDRGKEAYDHATKKGNAFSSILGKVTTNDEGHVTTIVEVTKKDITDLGIPAQDTTYDVATQSKAGLESAEDKTKLDNIEEYANQYILPTATASVLGGVKTGSNITNTSGTISLTKANVTSALGYTPPTTNTTYSKATTSTDGLMSATDKTKLDGIEEGADKTTKAKIIEALGYTPEESGATEVKVTPIITSGTKIATISVDGEDTDLYQNDLNATIDSALSSTSTNPVQNKVINSKITTLEKSITDNQGNILTIQNKLNTIEEGANKTVVDSALNPSSTNPVQNKLVTASITEFTADMNMVQNSIGVLQSTDESLQSQLNAKLDTSSANYIKSLSASGRTITYTKGNGSSGSFNTQDTVPTYANVISALGFTPANYGSEHYYAVGQVMNGANGLSGHGRVDGFRLGNLVIMSIQCMLTNVPSSSESYDWGINRGLLMPSYNGNFPTNLCPLTGGTISLIDYSGGYGNYILGYAPIWEANGEFWRVARVYNSDGSIGQWAEKTFNAATKFSGIFFGYLS